MHRHRPFDIHGVTREIAATAIGLSPRRFHELVKAKILPAPLQHGKYDLPSVVRAWTEYVAADKEGDATIAAAKRRFWNARADIEELEVDEKAGGLIPYGYAETVVMEAIATLRAECDGNAGRLAADLAAQTDAAAVRRRLLDEYRAACARAAVKVSELREPTRAAPGASGGNDDADPDENDGAVDED